MPVTRTIPPLPRPDVPVGEITLANGQVLKVKLSQQWYRWLSELVVVLGDIRDQAAQTYSDVPEMTAPAAPAADIARIYVDDNGSGKTRLMVRFSSGAAQQIAIQP